MSGAKLAEGAWVVVCDGAKALLLQNVGDAKFPNLKTLSVRQHDDPSTRDQGAERPGRVHNAVGAARSAVEQTDWHERSEAEFLRALIADLAAKAEAGEFRALAIVAPPKALGVMRTHYTARLKKALTHEVPHDYVGKPVHEIERLLTQ